MGTAPWNRQPDNQPDLSDWTHPRLAAAVHRWLGPPLACVVATADALFAAAQEFRRAYRRSYRSVRSWHADNVESSR